MQMTKEQIEKRLGCPIKKLPMGETATIVADSHGHKGKFDVLRVVVMEEYTRPYIEFRFKYPSGKIGVSQCYTDDYGLTWAASIYDWEFAKSYRNTHAMPHLLKLADKYWEAVRNGKKTFEVRFNDRNFKAGDHVKFRRVESMEEMGMTFTITYVLTHDDFPQGIPEGWCVFAIEEE